MCVAAAAAAARHASRSGRGQARASPPAAARSARDYTGPRSLGGSRKAALELEI